MFDPFWGDEGFMLSFDPEFFLEEEVNNPFSSVNEGIRNTVEDMVEESLEERKIAENILKRREGKKDKPAKVPLADRHTTRGNMTPFARWATKANLDHKNAGDDIEYTKEERHQIYDAEGDWDG